MSEGQEMVRLDKLLERLEFGQWWRVMQAIEVPLSLAEELGLTLDPPRGWAPGILRGTAVKLRAGEGVSPGG